MFIRPVHTHFLLLQTINEYENKMPNNSLNPVSTTFQYKFDAPNALVFSNMPLKLVITAPHIKWIHTMFTKLRLHRHNDRKSCVLAVWVNRFGRMPSIKSPANKHDLLFVPDASDIIPIACVMLPLFKCHRGESATKYHRKTYAIVGSVIVK